MTEQTRHKLVHAVTEYDRRQEARYAHKGPGFYNRYALPQYLGAIQQVEEDVADGRTLRQALCMNLTGRLLDACLKAVGEPTSTRMEQR